MQFAAKNEKNEISLDAESTFDKLDNRRIGKRRCGVKGGGVASLPNWKPEEWDEVVEYLVLHATGKVNQLYWRGVTPDPNEIAAEAVTSVIDGRRTWNQAAYPDARDFLRGVVDSIISHDVKCVDRERVRSFDHSSDSGRLSVSDTAAPETHFTTVVANKELAEFYKSKIIAEIQPDKLALRILECIEAGFDEPKDIAECLGEDVKEINNARKRLQRAIDSIRNSLKKGARP